MEHTHIGIVPGDKVYGLVFETVPETITQLLDSMQGSDLQYVRASRDAIAVAMECREKNVPLRVTKPYPEVLGVGHLITGDPLELSDAKYRGILEAQVYLIEDFGIPAMYDNILVGQYMSELAGQGYFITNENRNSASLDILGSDKADEIMDLFLKYIEVYSRVMKRKKTSDIVTKAIDDIHRTDDITEVNNIINRLHIDLL